MKNNHVQQVLENGLNATSDNGNNDKFITEGDPGEFLTISKHNLLIDHSYQRDRKSTKNIQDYAKSWSWYACGALSVVNRSGKFYVIDGQHRLEAALLRKDIDKLPCILFQSDGIKDEAKRFLEANNKRSAVTIGDKVKALEKMEDQVILDIKDIIESTGHILGHKSVTKKVRVITCVATLIKTYKINPEIFKKIWPLNAAIHKDSAIHGMIWEGLFYLERYCITQNRSILEDRFENRLIKTGREKILSGISDARVFYKAGGAYVYAMALAGIMNYGLPTDKRITPPQRLPMAPPIDKIIKQPKETKLNDKA